MLDMGSWWQSMWTQTSEKNHFFFRFDQEVTLGSPSLQKLHINTGISSNTALLSQQPAWGVVLVCLSLSFFFLVLSGGRVNCTDETSTTGTDTTHHRYNQDHNKAQDIGP